MRRKLRSTFLRTERLNAYTERAGKGDWVGDWTMVRCACQSVCLSCIGGMKVYIHIWVQKFIKDTFLHPVLGEIQ